MTKWSINPRRLQWCLKHYGLSLRELAKDAHIGLPTLEKAAAGEEVLTHEQLILLSASCEVQTQFLMRRGNLNEREAPTPQLLGAKACLPPDSADMLKLITHIERRRDDYAEVVDGLHWKEMMRAVRLPRFSVNGDFAANAAKVRRWLGIKGGESFDDLRQLVEGKNIMVFMSQRYKGRWMVPEEKRVAKFKGFTLDYASLPVLFVTMRHDRGEQAFAMMHGLGHLIMHKGSKVEDAETLAFFPKTAKREEEEANMLASHILLPESAIEEIDCQNFERLKPQKIKERLRPICEKYCIDAAPVLARLHGAEKVSAAACKRYEEWAAKRPFNSNGFKPRKPIEDRLHAFGHRYAKTIVAAAKSRVITTYRAMVYLAADFDGYMRLEEWARGEEIRP